MTGNNILAGDTLDLGTTPIALEAGAYELDAFLADANGQPTDDRQCTLTITVEAASNVGYQANFASSGCDWAPAQSDY